MKAIEVHVIKSDVPMTSFDVDVQFEKHYVEVLAFVKKMKHASCFELQKEFHIRYVDAVHLMDTLDARDIVDVPESEHKGGRPLLTEAGKKLKRERQQREREEKQREAAKPKPEPEPQRVEPKLPVEEPVSKVRVRTRRKNTRK